MTLSIRDYLKHILDEADYLKRNSSSLEKDEFLKDETLKRAFVRSLEIIGEAVKQLPEDLRQNYAQIEWRLIAGMRDRLIHGHTGGGTRIRGAGSATTRRPIGQRHAPQGHDQCH